MDASLSTLIMILCYVVGTGLILMEAFIPGFGIAGIAGIILEIVAIALTNAGFGLVWSLAATFIVMLFIGVAVFLSYRSAMKGRLSKSALVLKDTEAPAGEAKPDHWIGREGVAVTSLRPAGQIEIDGTRLNAASDGEFIKRGTPVLVTGAEGDHYTIRVKD